MSSSTKACGNETQTSELNVETNECISFVKIKMEREDPEFDHGEVLQDILNTRPLNISTKDEPNIDTYITIKVEKDNEACVQVKDTCDTDSQAMEDFNPSVIKTDLKCFKLEIKEEVSDTSGAGENVIGKGCASSVDKVEIKSNLNIKEELDENIDIDTQNKVSVDENLIGAQQCQHVICAIPKGKNRAAGTATSCNAQTATTSKHTSGTNDLVPRFDNGGPTGYRHLVKKNINDIPSTVHCEDINKKLSLVKDQHELVIQFNNKSVEQCNLTGDKKTSILDKPFACDQCDYRSNRKTHLLQHYRVHTKEKPFACNMCDYKASNKQNLKLHIKKHTNDTPFACNICDYKSRNKHHLKLHFRIHSKEKPFACGICDYRGRQKHHLMEHIRTHIKEKPLAFDIRDLESSTKNYLLAHIRNRVKLKTFVCDICNFKCDRKHNLIRHIRTHTNEKPFACNICGFKFIQKHGLEDHVRTHTKEKPFACTVCDRKFSRKQSLVRHSKRHTKEKSFAFNNCDFKFIAENLARKTK